MYMVKMEKKENREKMEINGSEIEGERKKLPFN